MEQIEDLQYCGLKMIQNDVCFRFGTDAVLLSSFVRAGKRDHIVDLGTGTGILALLLAARTGARITGVELQREAAALARRNVALNKLSRVEILEADLRALPRGLFASVVVSNPPYEPTKSGAASDSHARAFARHELGCTLPEVARSAAGLLKTGGRFYMVHRADRAAEALYLLHEAGLEPKELRFVQKDAKTAPKLLLVGCKAGAKPGLRVAPALLLYDETGEESAELKQIYHKEETP